MVGDNTKKKKKKKNKKKWARPLGTRRQEPNCTASYNKMTELWQLRCGRARTSDLLAALWGREQLFFFSLTE
jgi:hypothetical protein